MATLPTPEVAGSIAKERVETIGRGRVSIHETVADGSDPSVAPGEKLTRGGVPLDSLAAGSAGPVVLVGGVEHLLTAAHVVGAPMLPPDKGPDFRSRFYSPEPKVCLSISVDHFATVVESTMLDRQVLGMAKRDPNGVPGVHKLGGRDYGADGALLELIPNLDWSNEIDDIGPITGERDLIGEISNWSAL
ncbi:MAG: hypothetical protein AAGF12_27440, partial [Myxococcota bacterium]